MRRTWQIVRMGKERTVRIINKWRQTAVRRFGRQRLTGGGGVRGAVGEWRFRICVRWLWMEKHRRELYSRPADTKCYSVMGRRRRR